MGGHGFPGRFIVIEGADGAGTTTQSELLARELDAYWTKEPTDGKIGRRVDEMISDGDYSPESIAMAFAADRMDHLEEEIIPRLERGETVICDRYYHSSFVYQPALGAEEDAVHEMNRFALSPDLTVILDISPEIGMERIDSRGSDDHIFEDMSFQEQVVHGYRRLEERLDEEIIIVDGSAEKERVFQEVRAAVEDRS